MGNNFGEYPFLTEHFALPTQYQENYDIKYRIYLESMLMQFYGKDTRGSLQKLLSFRYQKPNPHRRHRQYSWVRAKSNILHLWTRARWEQDKLRS